MTFFGKVDRKKNIQLSIEKNGQDWNADDTDSQAKR